MALTVAMAVVAVIEEWNFETFDNTCLATVIKSPLGSVDC